MRYSVVIGISPKYDNINILDSILSVRLHDCDITKLAMNGVSLIA